MSKKMALLLVGLLVIAGASAVGQKVKTEKPHDRLHDEAKKAGGGFVLRYKPNRSTIYPNIEELAKRSDLIIVGRTLGNQSQIRPDGNFITKDFLVKVQEVIKGELPVGSRSIVVSLPGGGHRFPDGTYAMVSPLGQKEAQDNGVYVFFLKAKTKKKDPAFKGHLLASETQGLFALTNGKVEPADLAADDPIVVKYRDMDVPSFLSEIHKAVPRKKK